MFLHIVLVLLLVSTPVLSLPSPTQSAGMPAVVINELMWMGSSASSADEWIELRNTTSAEVDLSGWKITKKSGSSPELMLAIPDGKTIPASGYFLIANYDHTAENSHLDVTPDVVSTDVALVNSGLQIELYTAADVFVDSADDGVGKPLAGEYVSGTTWKSMERVRTPGNGTQATDWKTSSQSKYFDPGSPEYGTPGAANSNAAPIADAGADLSVEVGEVTTLDASLSTDPDHDPLLYTWDFGDGSHGSGVTPTHAFNTAATYLVTLQVHDGVVQSEDTLEVVVSEPLAIPAPEQDDATTPSTDENHPEENEAAEYMTGQVLLNEVFPNPAGRDQEGEFIELYNADAKAVSLAGWKVTNDKTSYVFSDEAVAAGAFLSLSYAKSKVLLRNSGGVVRLVDPFGTIVSGLEYSVAEEGMSFARVNDTVRWEWSALPTPGSENEITQDEETKDAEVNDVDQDESVAANTSTATVEQAQKVAIADIRELPSRTVVQVEGVVTAAPGMFSVSSLWIQDATGALEVYSSVKAFPELELGDLVRLTGTVSSAGEGLRINQRKDEMEIIGREDIAPLEISCSDLAEQSIGMLVTLEAKISASTKTKITLQDDATCTAVAKKGTALDLSAQSAETMLRLTGIVGWSSSGVQIWPRTEADIQTVDAVLGEEDANVEPSASSSTADTILQDDRKTFPVWVVACVLLLMVIIAAWWYLKYRHRVGV